MCKNIIVLLSDLFSASRFATSILTDIVYCCTICKQEAPGRLNLRVGCQKGKKSETLRRQKVTADILRPYEVSELWIKLVIGRILAWLEDCDENWWEVVVQKMWKFCLCLWREKVWLHPGCAPECIASLSQIKFLAFLCLFIVNCDENVWKLLFDLQVIISH